MRFGIGVADAITFGFFSVDSLEVRSEGAKNWQSTYKVDKYSILRLGDQSSGQSNRYDVAIHSLTIWTRKLSEDEIEARFTKGLLE